MTKQCTHLIWFLALSLSPPMTLWAETTTERHVITSVETNKHTETWTKQGQGWSINKYTLHGGKQEGVEVIRVETDKLQLSIIPTRGMSIYEVKSGDIRLGWDSPVEEIVHPALIDLESRGGLGWLEGFNEWMVRCGLEFAGHPGTDEFVTNTGETKSMDLTLHGKIGNIPASEVEVVIEQTKRTRITVKGIVYEKSFYGPKLKLETAVSVTVGEDAIEIHDTLTNQGSEDQEFQLIYHANFGQPLLEAGSEVHVAAKSIAPMNDHAAQSIESYAVYQKPTAGFIEQVYLCEPVANSEGKSAAVLCNQSKSKAASLHWQTKQLPYLTIWKNTADERDGYVTGIEPATGYPYNRMVEREAGRVPKLTAGESRNFDLRIELHHSAAEVKQMIKEMQTIQGESSPQLIKSPQ